jgi:acyl-coenzyme A thioesterase PaaI-like protein
MSASSFAELTAVTPIAPDEYGATIDETSWIVRGPNGGFLAALVVRAVEHRLAEVEGPVRAPRSITLHYPAVPANGDALVRTRVVRVGRSLATVAAEIVQGDRVSVSALVACSPAWPGGEWSDNPMPAVPARAAVPLIDRQMPLPYMAWWEQRPCLGPGLFSGSDRAETGGWLALRDGGSLDAAAVAAMTDAWPPAAFARTTEPMGAPTVDLTIHLRTSFPTPSMPPGEAALVRFTSSTARDGFFEEDGTIWAPDGTLLAQSRQLALLL